MAKALIGHLRSDQRFAPRLGLDNQRLRNRVAELESLVLRLQVENDRLVAERSAAAEAAIAAELLAAEMLPA